MADITIKDRYKMRRTGQHFKQHIRFEKLQNDNHIFRRWLPGCSFFNKTWMQRSCSSGSTDNRKLAVRGCAFGKNQFMRIFIIDI
ncbi:hypothetical protein JW835_14305, partial [bacterium]|nr:hypothetical protein [bacterium]